MSTTLASVHDQHATLAPRSSTTRTSKTMLLHVNLPTSLVMAVRNLADEERRTITSQVALLLEDSPELIEYLNATSNAASS